MCTIEQLKERIDNNINKVNENEARNREEHKILSNKIDKVLEAVEWVRLSISWKTIVYDDRYVLRRDFRIASSVVWLLITILAFIWFSK